MSDPKQAVGNDTLMLYEEESKGLDSPEKISTRWPARCHVTYHVHVAEFKETAQVPPYQQYLIEIPARLLPGVGARRRGGSL